MTEIKEQEGHPERLQSVHDLLARGARSELTGLLAELHPAETALLLESLPPAQRAQVWELAPDAESGEILVHLSEDVRNRLIEQMGRQELVSAAEKLDVDDLADFLQDLPDAVIAEVLHSMDHQHRQRVEAVLSYPEDTAGGLMNTDAISVRADITLDVVLRYLRFRGELPETTDTLMVVDRDGKYLGLLALTDLLIKSPDLTVAEVISKEVEAIPADLPAREVANLFERRDLVSAPVVDSSNRLLGRITIDDVVDVIREEADHSFMSMAGLSEESDIFSPVVSSVRQRALWLGINLLTALLAASVIRLFEGTIEQVVALAVLMPMVASMGGIAGSQTLILVIRGLALGQIGPSNARRLLVKELAVGALNGTLWAIVIAAVAIAWFGDYEIGFIIAGAILANLLCAALVGATIPLALRKLNIDPALAGSIVLTTFTDCIGFLVFLGLATLFLI